MFVFLFLQNAFCGIVRLAVRVFRSGLVLFALFLAVFGITIVGIADIFAASVPNMIAHPLNTQESKIKPKLEVRNNTHNQARASRQSSVQNNRGIQVRPIESINIKSKTSTIKPIDAVDTIDAIKPIESIKPIEPLPALDSEEKRANHKNPNVRLGLTPANQSNVQKADEDIARQIMELAANPSLAPIINGALRKGGFSALTPALLQNLQQELYKTRETAEHEHAGLNVGLSLESNTEAVAIHAQGLDAQTTQAQGSDAQTAQAQTAQAQASSAQASSHRTTASQPVKSLYSIKQVADKRTKDAKKSLKWAY